MTLMQPPPEDLQFGSLDHLVIYLVLLHLDRGLLRSTVGRRTDVDRLRCRDGGKVGKERKVCFNLGVGMIRSYVSIDGFADVGYKR